MQFAFYLNYYVPIKLEYVSQEKFKSNLIKVTPSLKLDDPDLHNCKPARLYKNGVTFISVHMNFNNANLVKQEVHLQCTMRVRDLH